MRIKKVTLHGVGPFEHQEIEFREGKNPDLADVTLLVGENGTGKSTILYGIATAVGGREPNEASQLLQERKRPPGDGHAGVEFEDREQLVRVITQNVFAMPTKSWAAFAYAGIRQLENIRVKGIEEQEGEPLSGALAFTSGDAGNRFAQWLALANYRRREASATGSAKAARFHQAIARVEGALSEMFGEPISFAFPFDRDPTPRVEMRGESLNLNVLPDGVKSILSWVGDLFMRHDRLEWVNDLPIEQREFLLLLDEIDVHLHPAWQRRVLPLAQRLFPKAQIIATTHSPLVVASADDAHVVVLRRNEKGQPTVENLDSQIGSSYSAVLRSVFGIESEFDKDTQDQLDKLHAIKRELLARTRADRAEFDQLASALAGRSEELSQIVSYEKRQLDRQLKGAN